MLLLSSSPPRRAKADHLGLRQQPTPRSFFAPSTTPQRPASHPRSSSASQQHHPQHNHQSPLQQQPGTNGAHVQVFSSGNAHHFPDFRPGPHTLPMPRAVPTPRTDPASFPISTMRRRRGPEINGIHNNQPVGGPRLGGKNRNRGGAGREGRRGGGRGLAGWSFLLFFCLLRLDLLILFACLGVLG